MTVHPWPASAGELDREQDRIAALRPPPWRPAEPLATGGCFACFPRSGTGRGGAGDPAWVAAVTVRAGAVAAEVVLTGHAGAPYEPGRLALREGALLSMAAGTLSPPPDVLLIDATGRDHPRRAGLALHLGALLDLPTVGVTHRPLLADGAWPSSTAAGASSPLLLKGEPVALWVRTRAGARPLAIHPGWRTDAATACAVVLDAVGRARTPEPLRAARRLARTARAGGR